MLLLAVDTSGRSGSLALARVDGSGTVEILEEWPLAGGSFSAQLVPQAGAMLDRLGYRKSDLAAFAVASGPGSFTGLRVGLAAIKALAEILHKPIAAVPLLEAVARSGPKAEPVWALLDAGRSELYAGDYDPGPPARMLSERLLGREEFSSASRRQMVLTPDVALAGFARDAGFPVAQVPSPSSAAIARLGWERILRGETVTPESLEANYIRRTDAEIFSRPKA